MDPAREHMYRDQTASLIQGPQVHRPRRERSNTRNFYWNGKWLEGKPTDPKIPYRLPELLAAPPRRRSITAKARRMPTTGGHRLRGHERERRRRGEVGCGADALLQGPPRRDPARRRGPAGSMRRRSPRRSTASLRRCASSISIPSARWLRRLGLAGRRHRWREVGQAGEGRSVVGADREPDKRTTMKRPR